MAVTSGTTPAEPVIAINQRSLHPALLIGVLGTRSPSSTCSARQYGPSTYRRNRRRGRPTARGYRKAVPRATGVLQPGGRGRVAEEDSDRSWPAHVGQMR